MLRDFLDFAMVLKGVLYNAVFRRNSTYAAFIVAGAVMGEKFLNDVVDSHWRESNRGVRASSFPSFASFIPSSCIFQKLFIDQEFSKSQ
jgi:hypothetical protein